ncbi:hypothetical protein TNIN_379201 [Trichonephila inaurata madagascariensis]|uniref:Uncharacterized protein n=1 Tax=Trichonephila inaurata madagascariensis TaxID=2747483 RepID=A0A8X6MKF6_9ARAC|nr:hypothetical protein TNIN_379201 [Trichonephila inaurata madagascariensis]
MLSPGLPVMTEEEMSGGQTQDEFVSSPRLQSTHLLIKLSWPTSGWLGYNIDLPPRWYTSANNWLAKLSTILAMGPLSNSNSSLRIFTK